MRKKRNFARELVKKVFKSYGDRLVQQFETSLRLLLGKNGEYYERNERAIMDVMSVKANCSLRMYQRLLAVENQIFNRINRELWD